MTKQELLIRLEDLKKICGAQIAAAYIFGAGTWKESFKNFNTPGFIYDEKGVLMYTFPKPSNFVNLFDQEQLSNTSHNIIRNALTNSLTQAYETTINYSTQSGQLKITEEFDWFHFLRIIRNALGHTYQININTYKGKQVGDIELAFSTTTLRLGADMYGKIVDYSIMPPALVIELIDKVITSVESTLS